MKKVIIPSVGGKKVKKSLKIALLIYHLEKKDDESKFISVQTHSFTHKQHSQSSVQNEKDKNKDK